MTLRWPARSLVSLAAGLDFAALDMMAILFVADSTLVFNVTC